MSQRPRRDGRRYDDGHFAEQGARDRVVGFVQVLREDRRSDGSEETDQCHRAKFC
jgi:hypothetical protein